MFLKWFNASTHGDAVMKAALAHLWFVTLHPFDDGNGRIARAIADMALARSEGSPQRFYSMSAQIRQERNAYYDILEQTQRGTMDITPWMDWFLGCLGRAIDGAQTALRGARQSALLGDFRHNAVERSPAQGCEPPARRIRGKADDIEVRQADRVLAGHRATRHSQFGGSGNAVARRRMEAAAPSYGAGRELEARSVDLIYARSW